MRSNGGCLVAMFIMDRHRFIMRAHRFTGNGDTGITGMRSGAARGRWCWIVNPVYAVSEPGLGNNDNDNIGMSTYSKGTAMGSLNSTPSHMKTNLDININNSWIYAEMEGQGSGGRHQATDHSGTQEDAAEIWPTEARSRKRWTKDENKKI